MRLLFFILLVAIQPAYAKTQVKMGTFSLATEAGWSAAFELRENGLSVITPSFDAENEDGSANPKPVMKHLPGTWKEVTGGIEIAYSDQRDLFRLEKECHDYPGYPCFHFQRSLTSSKKSMLKFDQPYINWDWKNPPKKPDPKKCRAECEKLKSEGILKQGMSLDQCFEATCK